MTTKEQLFADLEKDGITADANTINKAKNGDGDAMFSIGYEYYNKKKYDKAMAWYRLAADKNNSKAQRMIGVMYHNGEGVPKDYSLALEWYLKAAIQNNNTACENIGWLFENGYGVPANKYKALEWYTQWNEDTYSVKELAKQGIKLTQQDKNKSIEQLVKETEELAWPEKKYITENMLKEEEINTLKQLMNKMEEDSKAKDSRIKSLQEEVQSLRTIAEDKQQEINNHIEWIDQYKRKEQTTNNELQALKQINHAMTSKMEAKEIAVSALQNENKVLRALSENSTQGATKRVEEMERSNQSLERMLEQERQLKDNQIEVMKDKMEISLDKEKQKRNELERKYRAIQRELRNLKTPTQKKFSSKQASIKSKNNEDGSTNSSENVTDYDTEHDSAASDNNDINYDTPSEEDDGDDDSDDEKNENDLNYDSDEQSKTKKKIPSAQSASGSKK